MLPKTDQAFDPTFALITNPIAIDNDTIDGNEDVIERHSSVKKHRRNQAKIRVNNFFEEMIEVNDQQALAQAKKEE